MGVLGARQGWRGRRLRKLEKGFSDEDKRAMLVRLAPLRVRKLPMIAARKSPRRARWVKPGAGRGGVPW